MQHTVVKEFENDPEVVATVFDEGGRNGETEDWVQVFWANYYPRGFVFWDVNGTAGQNYKQPKGGIPFRRGFLIDKTGKVALPYFHYDPAMVIQSIKALKGGGLTCTPDTVTVSQATGGKVTLDVNGSPIRASNVYATAITLSGTVPGTVIEGVRVPINLDALTWAGLLGAGSPLFPDFIGTLDSRGRAAPAFVPGPGQIPSFLIGYKFWFAAVTFDPGGLSTSAASEVLIVK